VKRTNVSKITARTAADTRKLNGLVHDLTRGNTRVFRPVPGWAWAKDQHHFLVRVKCVYSVEGFLAKEA